MSPPPSAVPTSTQSSCPSVCALSQSCSEEGKKILAWSVDQVVEFISSFEDLKPHAEAFIREKIDGGTLVLLTDSHLTSLGVKLGPAIKFRWRDLAVQYLISTFQFNISFQHYNISFQ